MLRDTSQVYGTKWRDQRDKAVNPFTAIPKPTDWDTIDTNASYPSDLGPPQLKSHGTTLAIPFRGIRGSGDHFTIARDNFANEGIASRAGFHFNPTGRHQWKFDTEGKVQACKLNGHWVRDSQHVQRACPDALKQYLAEVPALDRRFARDERALAAWLRGRALAQKLKLLEMKKRDTILHHDKLVGYDPELRIWW